MSSAFQWQAKFNKRIASASKARRVNIEPQEAGNLNICGGWLF